MLSSRLFSPLAWRGAWVARCLLNRDVSEFSIFIERQFESVFFAREGASSSGSGAVGGGGGGAGAAYAGYVDFRRGAKMRPWRELAPEFSFRAVASGDASSASVTSNANQTSSSFGAYGSVKNKDQGGGRGSVTRFFDLLVPTPDTVWFAYLLDKLLSLPHRGGRTRREGSVAIL